MITFIDNKTGQPFEEFYQEYLQAIYQECPNPITEGDVTVSFIPNVQPRRGKNATAPRPPIQSIGERLAQLMKITS
jgi:hypothetical protein